MFHRVLRGIKGRFQLFGDTVNTGKLDLVYCWLGILFSELCSLSVLLILPFSTLTIASRMESTGAPGRIQISQSTADLLVARGKGHWLTAREDKIVAKGKGEMQTYFVSTAARTATRSRTASDLSEFCVDPVTSMEAVKEESSRAIQHESSHDGHGSGGTQQDNKSESTEGVQDQLVDYLSKQNNRGKETHLITI